MTSLALDNDNARSLSASMLRLRSKEPFFAVLALFARIEWTDMLPTAATDGRNIKINPAFWNALTGPQRDGLLLHEVLHCAFLHVPRLGQREPLRWNIAADIVVNGVVEQAGFTLPPYPVRHARWENLAVEEVYALIGDGMAQFDANRSDDLIIVPIDAPSEDPSMLDAHWRHALNQADLIARASRQGRRPAGLLREIDRLSPSRIDWRALLWRFLVRTPSDFSGFDRRFVWQELYLETLESESVEAFVAVDTSGSVSREMLEQFLGEVAGIVAGYPQIDCRLYYADAELHGPMPITERSPLPPPLGGGGTSFVPFFQAVERDASDAAVCIYLTDGYGAFPEHPPRIPTLWVVAPGGLSDENFPFGTVTRLIDSV